MGQNFHVENQENAWSSFPEKSQPNQLTNQLTGVNLWDLGTWLHVQNEAHSTKSTKRLDDDTAQIQSDRGVLVETIKCHQVKKLQIISLIE